MTRPRIPQKLAADALWDHALRLLSIRAHSAAELKRKLARRAESPSHLTSVLDKLREYGLIDDQKFSETFASSRLANTGSGRFRVLRELRSKQVSASVAEQAVAAAFEGTDEVALAQAFLLRKFRGKDLSTFLQQEKNLASAYQRLRTGGFSSSASLTVLKRYSRKAAEIDSPESPDEESDLG